MRVTLRAAMAAIAAVSSANGAVLTGPITNSANNHQYYLLSQNTWTASQAEAVTLGGHLATVNNVAENAYLVSTFGSFAGTQRLLWVGLNDAPIEGIYRWASGETPGFDNWAPGEPNASAADEDYIALYYPSHSAGGRWNDWNNRTSDPIGLPFNGVVEVVPEPTALAAVGVGAAFLGRRRRHG